MQNALRDPQFAAAVRSADVRATLRNEMVANIFADAAARAQLEAALTSNMVAGTRANVAAGVKANAIAQVLNDASLSSALKNTAVRAAMSSAAFRDAMAHAELAAALNNASFVAAVQNAGFVAALSRGEFGRIARGPLRHPTAVACATQPQSTCGFSSRWRSQPFLRPPLRCTPSSGRSRRRSCVSSTSIRPNVSRSARHRTFLNSLAFQRRLFGLDPDTRVNILLVDFQDGGNAGATAVPYNGVTIFRSRL